MKKIIKVIKNNIIGFILGIVVSITVGVYAATTLQGNTVYYDNSKSGGSSNTVSGALDELYQKAKITDFKVGDYVTMTPTSTSFTIPSTLTGYDSDQTINPSELNKWVVIRINGDNTVDMVSSNASSTRVYFKGQTGYQNYIGTLNYIAKQYENPKYTVKSRHMGYQVSLQVEYITDTSKLIQTTAPWASSTSSSTISAASIKQGGGDVGYETDTKLVQAALGRLSSNNIYCLASRYYEVGSNIWYFHGRTVNLVNNGNISRMYLYDYNKNMNKFESSASNCSIRPIVTLNSKIHASSGNGTSSIPYVLN